jgi:hypothetical protein
MPGGYANGGMLWGNAHSALRALRVNTLRSVLTMLGIVIGVAAVLAMVAVGPAPKSAWPSRSGVSGAISWW